MSETRYWICDGCGYRTTEAPNAGAFIRFSPDVTPMMEVGFVDQTGGTHREPEHVCQNCYEMGIVVIGGNNE